MPQRVSFTELSKIYQRLLNKAKEVMVHSSHDYSGFAVGAAVLTLEGAIRTGTNIEEYVFQSICAERVALAVANKDGYGRSCKAIAVVTQSQEQAYAPCDHCVPMIKQFAFRSGVGKRFEVISATTNFEKIVIYTLGELSPYGFGPEDLERETKEKETKKNPQRILGVPAIPATVP